MLLFSLHLSLAHYLANHFLNAASLTPLQFLQKPLIKLRVNTLLKYGQAFNTNNNIKSRKNKRKSETSL